MYIRTSVSERAPLGPKGEPLWTVRYTSARHPVGKRSLDIIFVNVFSGHIVKQDLKLQELPR